MSQVETRVESIADICDEKANGKIRFIIPSYQRPYVWSGEDVQKLLNDIVNAFEATEAEYYIGTIMSNISNHKEEKIYELIDGQQRITTLMLLAIAFSEKLPDHKISNLTKLANKPRLTFKIRDSVEAYMGAETGLEGYIKPNDIDTNDYLKGLHTGLKAAKRRLDELLGNEFKSKSEKLPFLADYLYSNVKWVNNAMPQGTDLNLLFKRVNTSGIQLEQSDLLKARLLKVITNSEDKAIYDAIWQSCENMENYFERNVRALFKGADWDKLVNEDLFKFCPERFKLKQEDQLEIINALSKESELTIDAIATSGIEESKLSIQNTSKVSSDDEDGKTHSIISFSLLLIHTYRIYLGLKVQENEQKDITSRLHVEQFNKSFKGFPNTKDEAKAFIEYLWKVRYQFDRHIVKWVVIENESTPHLYLSNVTKVKEKDNGMRLSRSVKEISNLVQLQAVRYFTGEHSAQYWLTPLLGWLVKLENTTKTEDAVLEQLEKIDGALSLSSDTQKEASFALLRDKDINQKTVLEISAGLNDPNKGTGFEHYWFQKLEYILWKKRADLDFLSTNGKPNEKLNRYRITSKNSVEHIHPQHHKEPTKQLKNEEGLNSFGNLALLSAGQNSSYSNKSVGEKSGQFNDQGHYDSLKLVHIFNLIKNEEDWNKETIAEHQKVMIEMIEDHYKD